MAFWQVWAEKKKPQKVPVSGKGRSPELYSSFRLQLTVIPAEAKQIIFCSRLDVLILPVMLLAAAT